MTTRDVEDRLEETRLIIDGLREYRNNVDRREAIEDTLQYNLRMAAQHLAQAVDTLDRLGEPADADWLNQRLNDVCRIDDKYWTRHNETQQELRDIRTKLQELRGQRHRLKNLQAADQQAKQATVEDKYDDW